ncbi:MAG: tyrosine-protein phosphatase [Sediminibacterium sp.]
MKSFIFLSIFSIFSVCVNSQISDSIKRQVKLEGAINFRDIGGYENKNGKHIKWGKIYRSASLNGLTQNDLEILKKLALSYVIDFRGPFECKTAPDKIPANALYLNLPAGSENIGDSNYLKNMMRSIKNDSSMINFYSDLTPFKDRYKPMFDQLLKNNKDSAILFHCSAGKDRTGIAAALILYALGVDEKTIMDDYLATNFYRKNENEKAINAMVKMYRLDESAAKNMMSAKESYLNATFNAIKYKYGSIDNYLRDEMGLTNKKIKLLKSFYLE